MALEKHFEVNYENAKSKSGAILQGNKYRITILSELLVRLEYSEDNIFEDRPTDFAIFRNFDIPEFKVEEDEKYLFVSTNKFELQYIKGKPFIGPSYAPEANLKISIKKGEGKTWYFKHPEARNFNSIIADLDKSEGQIKEEQLDLKKVKKKAKELLFKEKGLFSADGFASIDDSKSLIIDEDGSIKNIERFNIDTYVFLYGKDFTSCLRDYFKLTGKPPLIPRYSLGIWWNKNDVYNYDDTKKLISEFNRNGIPLSVLLLGDNWHMKDVHNLKKFTTGFTFNPDLFPNPYEFAKFMHDKGIRVGVSIDPSEGLAPHEAKYDEIAKELNISEKQVIPINVYDKNIMSIYLSRLINNLYNTGVDLFWINYKNKDDNNTTSVLNYYHFNDYKKNPNQRGIVLSRISKKAPHRYPIHYSGETTVSWDTLKTLPAFNSTSSNIGLSWWSHDIGGYKDGIEDSELYTRYVQYGVFSPIFRFSAKYGKYYKREPWKWDVQTYNIVKEYCQLRHRLIPYIYSEAYRYSHDFIPLIQPLYYVKPQLIDEPIYRNEYFFGSQFLVAPITRKKDDIISRSVEQIYVPEGMWYDFKTGKKFPGNKRYIAFFKDEDYPVFAKSGSIIPMAMFEENINVTNSPKGLEIHVFPGESNSYNLYEDDGNSSLHEEGYYIITKIDYNYMANNYTLIVRPIEGKSGIIPAKRNYKIRFRNTREANEVIVYIDNTKVDSFSYTDDNDFIVEVRDVPTTGQLTINCKGKDIEIDAVRLVNEEIESIINDVQIDTRLKELISNIIFSELSYDRKRIEIRKLKKEKLPEKFITTFIKLLEYVKEI